MSSFFFPLFFFSLSFLFCFFVCYFLFYILVTLHATSLLFRTVSVHFIFSSFFALNFGSESVSFASYKITFQSVTSQCIRLGEDGDGEGGMPLSFCPTSCFCSKQQQKATKKTLNIFSLLKIFDYKKSNPKTQCFFFSFSLSLLKIFGKRNGHTNLNNYVLSLRIAQERSDCPSEHLLPFLSILFVSVFVITDVGDQKFV